MQDADLQEPTRVKLYSVKYREGDEEEGVPSILVEGSPVKNGKLLDPLWFLTRSGDSREEQDQILQDLNALAASEDPYLWVLQVARVGDLPVCAVADHNVWERIQESIHDRRRKELMGSSLLFFLGGILLGGVGGWLLGRR